jgi:hypothetical protein
MTVFIVWALQSIISFILLCKAYLFSWDVELGDAISFVILSLIPGAILASILVYLVEWNDHRPLKRKNIVIFKRKKKKNETKS